MYPTQPPNQDEPPQGYYSVGGGTDRGIRPSREGIFKWIKRGMFGLTVLAIIGGSLYGVNHFFGVAEIEREKLALAREANDAAPEDVKVYFGDGSDIIEILPAEEVVECPSGYEDKSGSCQKIETITVSAAVYECPDGYSKKGEDASTTCVKVVGGTTESKSAIETLSCVSGYDRAGDSCAKTETVDAIISYECPVGHDTSGAGAATKCTKTTTQAGNVIASCSSGSLRGSGASATCVRTTSGAATPSTSYWCDAGYTRSGSGANTKCTKPVQLRTGMTYCSKYTTASGFGSFYYKYVSAILGMGCATAEKSSTAGSCPGSMGSKKVSGSYVYYCYYRAGAPCPSGYTSGTGSFCIKNTTENGAVRSNTTYRCSSGSLSGSSCIFTSTVAANLNCEGGFARAGSGTSTSCSKVTISNVSVKTLKSCRDNYTAQGDKCQRTITTAAKKAVGCSDGFKLTGSKCIRTVGGDEVKASPSITYDCQRGFTSVGTGDSMKCEKTETKTAEKTKQYKCEEGWTKRQAGDKIDCVLLRA